MTLALPELPDPSPILAELRDFKVTAENYQEVCDSLIEVKSQYKRLDEEEKKITDPLKVSMKAAKDWFGKPKKVYEQLEVILKNLVVGYQAELQAVKRQAIAEISQGSPDARHTLAVIADSPQPVGIQTREIWDFEIVDRTKVPGQFWVIDEAAIRQYAGKNVDVPGVRFFKKQIIAVKT
jgi:hypothetical protein